MGKTSRRPSFMMRGLAAVVAVAIAIGIWLGGLFDDFGFNSGSDGGKTMTPLLSSSPESNLLSTPDSEPDQNQNEAAVEPVGTQEVVVVIIDDRNYFLRADIGVTETRVSLDALLEMVKNAKGNEDDIRLRVFRRKSARASAENALKQSLSEANIADAAVQWVDEIIP